MLGLQAGDPPARADVVDVYWDPANGGQRQGRPENLPTSLSLPTVNLDHACATSDRGFLPSYAPSYHCDLASVKTDPATMANRGESVVEPTGGSDRGNLQIRVRSAPSENLQTLENT